MKWKNNKMVGLDTSILIIRSISIIQVHYITEMIVLRKQDSTTLFLRKPTLDVMT